MLYKYRVTLAGIKGFYRVYEMGGETTLYEFHKQMRADMEFPQDQLIMFKALDAGGGVVARYGLFDLGSGTVDNVTVAQTVKSGVASFFSSPWCPSWSCAEPFPLGWVWGFRHCPPTFCACWATCSRCPSSTCLPGSF